MGRFPPPVSLAVVLAAAVLLTSTLGAAATAPGVGDASGGRFLAVASPCSPCLPGATPRPEAATISWWNVTSEQFGALPPAAYGSTVANDPGTGEAVWFGGCQATECPAGSTWTYSNSSWANRTSNLSVSPPPRFGGSSAYDPNAGAVVLFGGVGANGPVQILTNDTWAFHGGSWAKLAPGCVSAQSPVRACIPSQAWSSLVYDPQPVVARSVLFGGCLDLACTGLSNATYWFNGTTGVWSYHTPSGVPNPSARAGASMAYDPEAGGLVLFGGEVRCGATTCPSNDTWLYSNGTWSNRSGSVGSALPPRAFASMSWDPVAGDLVLAGGPPPGVGPVQSPTYVLTCGVPAHCTWTLEPAANGPAIAYAATASDSTVLHPWMLGGRCAVGCSITNTSWEYSALPDLNIAVAPSRPEVSQTVYLNATAVGSLNPTFVFVWGDGTGFRSRSGIHQHVYPVAGMYNAAVAVIDPNGSANYHSVGILVVPPPTGTIVVEYRSVDVGIPDHFTAVPTLATGTPPFNFTWNFGAPPALYGASVVRTFPTPGSYPVNVSMVDNSGLRGWSTTAVNVSAAPTLSVAGQYRIAGNVTAERTVPVSFDANLVGGTPLYNFSWTFGDGGSGWGPGPTHSFDSVASSDSVQVVVVDAGGGSASGSLTVRIVPAVTVAGLSETPGAPTTGAPVQFHVDLTGGGGAESFAWTYGDGVTSVGDANASHLYGTPGTYTATVYVTDSIGGTTQQSITLTVTDSPAVGLLKALSNPWAILGLALLVAGVVALYLRTHPRRPHPAPEPDADHP